MSSRDARRLVNVAVCMCWLSDDRPFCDGSHRATEDEEEGVRYRYVDGDRRVIEELRLRE